MQRRGGGISDARGGPPGEAEPHPLNAGSCPNKRLQALWTEHGEAGFVVEVVKTLEYEDPAEDHTEELETLYELCLLERPGAERIWG